MYCLGCMKEIDDSQKECPFCGFRKEEYLKTVSGRALPLETILIGRYLIGKVLGEGGFGITYLAYDLQTDTPVAIKEYFPSGFASRSATQREQLEIAQGQIYEHYEKGLKDFEKEARILAKLQEIEGIVSVKSFFHENKTAYMVMEYIQGISLKEYVVSQGKPLSEKECLNLMKPIMEALVYVHKEGIIHRDISPDNIIIKKNGRTTLIDFGSARRSLGEETQSLTVLLKHGYAPVEQYQTRGKQGPYTDVYALCATMYWMVSGKKPIEAIERLVFNGLIPLKENIYNGEYLEVSQIFSDVIEKGMAVKSIQRYQNVESLLQALERCEETEERMDPVVQNVDEELEEKEIGDEQNTTQWWVNIGGCVLFLGALLVFWCLFGGI